MSSSLRAMYQRFKSLVSALIITPVDDGEPYFIISPKPLVPFGYSNNIENTGDNLYYSNNWGVREPILTPSGLPLEPLQKQVLHDLISADKLSTTYVTIMQFTVPETGIYKLNLKLKLNVLGSTNLYVKLLENGSLMNIRKNTAVETSEEIIPVTTNNPLYLDVYRNVYINFLTTGLTYTIQAKTSIADTIEKTSHQLITLERIKNYQYDYFYEDETGGI